MFPPLYKGGYKLFHAIEWRTFQVMFELYFVSEN